MNRLHCFAVILSALLVSLASEQATAVWLSLPAPYDEGQSRYYYPLPEGTPFLRIRPTLHNDLPNDLYITASGSSGYSGALPQPFDFSTGPNLNETREQNDDYLAQFHVEYTPFPTHFMIIPAGGTWELDYGVWSLPPDTQVGHYMDHNFHIGISTFSASYHIEFYEPDTPGESPSLPLLPDGVGPGGQFIFEVPLNEWGSGVDFPLFIDPQPAIAYAYEVGPDDPGFASVFIAEPLPQGDSEFQLIVDDDEYELNAGVPFDFTAIDPTGVRDFIIAGIDPIESLSPNDPEAFVTGLTFVGGQETVQVTMTAIIAEPSSCLLSFCLAVLGVMLRRQF